jgi:hypothetical protein
VVASLLPTMATAAATVETIIVGTAGDCPSTAVEDDTAALSVGYTPCCTLEEHR